MNLLEQTDSSFFVYESLDDNPKTTRKDPRSECSCFKIEKYLNSERCKSRTDCTGMFAMACIVIGVLVLLVGYLIPRHNNGDPATMTPEQYEKLENYYAKLGHGGDIAVLVALGLLSVGMCIMAVLLTWSAIEGFRHRSDDEGEVPLINKPLPQETKLLPTEDTEMDYGTTMSK